jgi:hypothetical protein
MVVAAFVLSIVAILVSAAAVWYARQQADAAQEAMFMANTPDFRLSVEPLRDQPSDVSGDLIIDYVKGPDLSKLGLEIVIPTDPPFEVPVPQFGPGHHTRTMEIAEPLRQGDTRRVPVILNPSPPQIDAVFRLTCWASGPWRWRDRPPERKRPWEIKRQVTPDWGQPGLWLI